MNKISRENGIFNNLTVGLSRAAVVAGFLFCATGGFAQTLSPRSASTIDVTQPAASDSIVQITAEAQGLSLVAPADVPPCGTFWEVTPDGNLSPLPCPAFDQTLPVYQIADNEFLVDATGGQISTVSVDGEAMSADTALTNLATVVVNLINQVQTATVNQQARPMMMASAMGMDVPSPGDGGSGDGSGYSPMFSGGTPIDTNGLWLQITNYDGNLAYVNLNNATDQVYAVWTTTNLLTGWQVEAELWPTTAQTNVLPFTVPTLGQPILFVRAEDWTGVTENGNTTPDWWFWLYFGTTALSDTNLDSQGNTLLSDYQNGTDPNIITFSLSVTNNYVNNMSAPVQLNIASGTPSYVAVSVDDTNYVADANWQNLSGTNITANLGMTQGWHDVWIGLRGLPSTATQTWQYKRLKLDLTPPLLVVTNSAASTVSVPIIQFQGFSPEALSSISYDLSNAAGLVTNQQVLVLDQHYDTNTWEFTTNTFQAFDVSLANGVNIFTVHATDLAGNVTTTNFSFTLDYSGKTNPPVVNLYWPPDGTLICNSNYTWRGWVNDPTATVTAQMVDTNGNTNIFTGIVERNGNFWVENLPLVSSTNFLTLTVTDSAGNVAVTNIMVFPSAIGLTITMPDSSQLWSQGITVNGTISDEDNYTVWVNGIKATFTDGTDWTATNVYLPEGGTALIQARAIPNSNNGGNGTGGSGGGPVSCDNLGNPDPAADNDAEVQTDKPSRLYMDKYTANADEEDFWHEDWTDISAVIHASSQMISSWTDAGGGSNTWIYSNSGNISRTCGLDETNWNYTTLDPQGLCLQNEHCSVNDSSQTAVQVGTSAFLSACVNVSSNKSNSTYARHAQATWKLQTGGKTGLNNLWQFSGSAAQMLNKRAGQFCYEWNNQPSSGIDPVNITIDGKALGADGNANCALPNNILLDVTPMVKGVDFYTFNISAQKYLLHITANDNPLSADHVRRGAYFCVGQSLTFAPVWSPSVPNVVNTIAHWSLPGEFVNEYVPPPSPENGSGSYIEDATLLANETTSCWYYNKLHPGTASIGLNLQFSNGQTVSLARLGQFDIYRPTISGFQPSPPYYAALVPTNSPNELQLGDNGAHGLMQYNITVNSIAPFSGGFNIVQLVNASRSLANTTYGGGQQQTTDGQFWLDNSSPYFVNGDSGIFSPYYSNSLRFFDQPGYGLNYIFGAYPANLCSINDSFKDYVVFKPDGANSIYVTLGRVFWSWSASTSKSGGVWSNPTYQVNGPSQPDDSDEFPTWPATLYNSGVGTGD